jgi:hypothetical protein
VSRRAPPLPDRAHAGSAPATTPKAVPPPIRRPPKRTPSRPPLTERDKEQLTLKALGLLREQVEARVVHYKAELQTSPELDAVTAQVVRQLKELQQAASRESAAQQSAESIERTQAATFGRLLRDMFINDKNHIARAIQPIGKRLAKLFFEHELNAKTAAHKDKVIHHAEQGLYYVLKRYEHQMKKELEALVYVSDEMKELTGDLLAKLQRDLQVGFLSRRSTELNRVMSVFTAVLVDFFQVYLAEHIQTMALKTIQAARSAQQPDSVPYKIRTAGFADFRAAWEHTLMTRMIGYCGDQFIARLEASGSEVRKETIAFFTDPHVYSETCDVICDELYDRLCMEGFLDIPVDWRTRIRPSMAPAARI